MIAALALWALNDHVLKATFSSGWTGKLSDMASLIVFPLLPVAALSLARRARGAEPPGNGHLLFWVVATGTVMATINTLDAAAWTYRHGLALAQWPALALVALARDETLPGMHTVHLTMDPTDLLTLPALLLPLRIGWRGETPRPTREEPPPCGERAGCRERGSPAKTIDARASTASVTSSARNEG